MVGAIVDEFSKDELTRSFNTTFDSQVQGGKVTTYIGITYFPDGWPSEIIKQTRITVGPTTKIEQRYITWDYRSVGNRN